MNESLTGGLYLPQESLASIDNWQDGYNRRFGANNNMFIQPRFQRIEWLRKYVSHLGKSLREDETEGRVEVRTAFARVMPRIYTVADAVPVRLRDGLMQKYPKEHCIYCKSKPCMCSSFVKKEIKRDLVFKPVNLADPQASWGNPEYQQHSRDLYGIKNGSDSDRLWVRLYEELDELVEMEHEEIPKFHYTSEELAVMYSHELADVYMRLVACANVNDIDLQEVSMERYGMGCAICEQRICRCRGITFKTMNP